MRALKNVVIFAALVLGFLLVNARVNELFTSAVLSKLLVYRREQQFQEVKSEIAVLFLGDSHSESGLWPELFPDSFNLSGSAENYVLTYYKTIYYLEEEPLDIELVTLPLDIHEFSSYRGDLFPYPFYWIKYVDYLELGIENGNLPYYFQKRLLGEFSIFNGLNLTIELMLTGYQLGEIDQGLLVRRRDLSEYPNIEGYARSRAKYHFQDADYLDPILLEYFLRTLKVLRDHKVNVVLIRFPVTQEYLKFASEYMSIEDFYQEVTDILKQNEFDYPILDYHDLYYGQYHLFGDPDHLNITGAGFFTKVLRDELIELELLP